MMGKLPPIYLLILSILLNIMQIISFNAYLGLLDVDLIQRYMRGNCHARPHLLGFDCSVKERHIRPVFEFNAVHERLTFGLHCLHNKAMQSDLFGSALYTTWVKSETR